MRPGEWNYTLPSDGPSNRSEDSAAPDLSIIIVNWNTRELLWERGNVGTLTRRNVRTCQRLEASRWGSLSVVYWDCLRFGENR
jgi:hypothetical protein